MEKSEFYSVCRLCIQRLGNEKKSFPLFDDKVYNSRVSLPERIQFCSNIEVKKDDGLPPQICYNCLSKLNQSFVFRNQCILANLTLQLLVNNNNINTVEIPNLLFLDLENQIITSSEDYSNIINKFNANKLVNTKINKRQSKEPLSIESNELCNNEEEKFFKNDEDPKTDKNISHSVPNIETKKIKSGKIFYSDTPHSKDEKSSSENLSVEQEVCNVHDKVIEKSEKEKFKKNIMKRKKEKINKISKAFSLGLKRERSSKNLKASKGKPSSYTCNYCQKVYPSEGGWRYHIHTMHNENYQPFICDLCGQSFKVKKNLEGHKNSIHYHLKFHLCDLCGREFASKYALKVHKIWHADVKNFSCEVCGTKFRTRGKLNTHKSIHGGPKNFMCHICSRKFRWKKDFDIHIRTHTGEKPFQCSSCGKNFASLTNMRKHERTHLEKKVPGENVETFKGVNEISINELCKNDAVDFVCKA